MREPAPWEISLLSQDSRTTIAQTIVTMWGGSRLKQINLWPVIRINNVPKFQELMKNVLRSVEDSVLQTSTVVDYFFVFLVRLEINYYVGTVPRRNLEFKGPSKGRGISKFYQITQSNTSRLLKFGVCSFPNTSREDQNCLKFIRNVTPCENNQKPSVIMVL